MFKKEFMSKCTAYDTKIPSMASLIDYKIIKHMLHSKFVQVYVIGCDENHHQWHLVSTDYHNSYSTLVFNGGELAQPFALGVFDGVVVWGSKTHGDYIVYSCKLTPACDIDQLEIVYRSQEVIKHVL